MKRFFNTAGPIKQEMHYNIDPLKRWDMEEILMLIEQQKYFIIHAPRQTGKTSFLLALRDYLNKVGEYFSVYINIEPAQAARNNVSKGIKAVVAELSDRVKTYLSDKEKTNEIFRILEQSESEKGLNSVLSFLSAQIGKPIVLLIDEIDALVGDTLISVLRQIRSGYDKRPESFPSTIILCGVRDIKDYRIQTSGQEIITGGSAFNIKSESLQLGNFTKDEVRELYSEHTKETGQNFADECYELIWEYTYGQPWLVNALAYEVTFKMKENRDRSVTITKEMIETAKNNLILSRATHLDQLSDKLKEERVRRVILPMIMNGELQVNDDDIHYSLDLGLIRKTERGYILSNAIYKEIIPRELTEARQDDFLVKFAPDWITSEGKLDCEKLICMFRQFWMENAEIWGSHIAGYEEAAPQLVFQAYLQRVANGNGFIEREYALGRGRTDLMLKWKSGKEEQRVVIELKMLNKKDKYETVKQKALEQTVEYALRCKATESHIIIFDRAERMNWREQVFDDEGESGGYKLKIWGM